MEKSHYLVEDENEIKLIFELQLVYNEFPAEASS